MRAKTFALIVVSLVLFAPSSAQQNAIIDNCCFVNRSCVTDQEWINGWHAFQRNECPASQPVAQASASVSAPAGQPIDNCCYVNRSCATNQDWVNGWHAFQRNECPASQPVAQASAPVSAPAGQPIDNCCYVDRQCQSNQDWIAGYQAFQYGQCAAPGQPQRATPSGSLPRISGSDIFVAHIIASLNWLKRLSPEWYHYVVNGMDSIVEVPTPVGGVWGADRRDGNWTDDMLGCLATANGRQRRVTMETCWLTWTIWGTGPPEYDQMTTVGVLAHEACHIYLRDAGIHFPTAEREEEECNKYYRGADLPLRIEFHRRQAQDPSLGWSNWWDVHYENDMALIRGWCADKSAGYGFRPELFCATLRNVQGL